MSRVYSVLALLSASTTWLGVCALSCSGLLEFPFNLVALPLMLVGACLYTQGLIGASACSIAAGRAGLREPANLAAMALSVLACAPCWLPLFAGPVHGLYAHRGLPVICVAEGGRYQWIAGGEVERTAKSDNDFSFDGRLSHTGLTWSGGRTITLHRDEPPVVLVRIGRCRTNTDKGLPQVPAAASPTHPTDDSSIEKHDSQAF